MIKTATFKIKVRNEQGESSVLCAIHCPIEILFDSIKKTEELLAIYNYNKENCILDYLFITAADYYDENGNYVEFDCLFSDICAVVESSSYFEFMKHANTKGFYSFPKKEQEDED